MLSSTTIAWTPAREIALPEWAALGRKFGEIARCSPWWLGDWIRYGNARFGEKYARAATITKYDIKTLMNMVYVAGRFETSRRREILTWSHHAELAGLELEEQDVWLDRAIADKWSVADLRAELRGARAPVEMPASGEIETDAGPEQSAVLTCPHCGGDVPMPHADSTPSLAPISPAVLPPPMRAA